MGDGWRAILEQLCADLENQVKADKIEEFSVVQIKEKFGGLRVYCSYEGKVNDRVRELVRNAEKMSDTTCEVCGKTGEIRLPKDEPYWYKCCCMAHYLKWLDNYY